MMLPRDDGAMPKVGSNNDYIASRVWSVPCTSEWLVPTHAISDPPVTVELARRGRGTSSGVALSSLPA
ncbi:hypothetical protein PISMIDRAFT_671050 [Pisolithus microcarpus 441]|uniref:Uncharacterized protein n=1 Tax=Pisolithus microcarpus 441 TaxID=765257 RepID=A0A0C9ZL09_9AGAM|nr:hypothetical protein PISMIDRAFT_671050 [Pisolithus microcarpus 441]